MDQKVLDDLKEHSSQGTDCVGDAFSIVSVSVVRCCGDHWDLDLSNANCTLANLTNRIEWKFVEFSRMF